MERRDMILNGPKSVELTADEESRLRKSRDDGALYLALTSSAGWKHLVENFINKEISQNRYLIAKTEELADIRAAQRELFDLLSFVDSRIKAGQEAFERLRK